MGVVLVSRNGWPFDLDDIAVQKVYTVLGEPLERHRINAVLLCQYPGRQRVFRVARQDRDGGLDDDGAMINSRRDEVNRCAV